MALRICSCIDAKMIPSDTSPANLKNQEKSTTKARKEEKLANKLENYSVRFLFRVVVVNKFCMASPKSLIWDKEDTSP